MNPLLHEITELEIHLTKIGGVYTLFQAMTIHNITIRSYEVKQDGIMRLNTKEIELKIPAGTVVDVYDVCSESSVGSSVAFARFVIYHASLPHFVTVGIEAFRPL